MNSNDAAKIFGILSTFFLILTISLFFLKGFHCTTIYSLVLGLINLVFYLGFSQKYIIFLKKMKGILEVTMVDQEREILTENNFYVSDFAISGRNVEFTLYKPIKLEEKPIFRGIKVIAIASIHLEALRTLERVEKVMIGGKLMPVAKVCLYCYEFEKENTVLMLTKWSEVLKPDYGRDWNVIDTEFYNDVWGWNPIARFTTAKPFYNQVYEKFIPLKEAEMVGMEIGCRVYFSQGHNRFHNEIVFREGKKEGIVSCTHIGITKTSLSNLPENVESSENVDINLPPEEHFVALWSYISGIAELGIVKIFQSAYVGECESIYLPFGFNSYMQAQVIRAISKVNSVKFRILSHSISMEILENDEKWLLSRVKILEGIFGFLSVIKTDEFVGGINPKLQEKVKFLLKATSFV